MAYILLLFTTVLLALQNISMKQYSVKAEKSNQLVFSGISTLAALVFFAVTAGAFEFNFGLLPYSIGFAIAYAAAVIGINLAIANGSLASNPSPAPKKCHPIRWHFYFTVKCCVK